MRLRLIKDKRRRWRKSFGRDPSDTSLGWTRTCPFTGIGLHRNIINMYNYLFIGRCSGRADALSASDPPYPGSFLARGVLGLAKKIQQFALARSREPSRGRGRLTCGRGRPTCDRGRPSCGRGRGPGPPLEAAPNNIGIDKDARSFTLPSSRI